MRHERGVKRKISRRQMSAIKREAVQESLLTSKQIFEQAGVSGIARTTRCWILNTVAKPAVKPSIHTPLTTRHRNQRIEWAKKSRQTSKPFFSQMSAEQPSMDQMAGVEVGL